MNSAHLHVVDQVPQYFTLPTLDEVTQKTRDTLLRWPELVSVRPLGASLASEPIDMVSVGSGPLSVLLIGTPHPNETIGLLTIEYLIQAVVEHQSLRDDCTWHFVKSIDPDGLRLNENWLSKPADMAAYLSGFYRPAFTEQGEYTFPLDVPGYRFDKDVPENLAYREAIRLARPHLVVPLHNSDFGGGVFFVSGDVPHLAKALSELPAKFGLSLETTGDLVFGTQDLAPGVSRMMDTPEPIIPGDDDRFWRAGRSCLSYCSQEGALGLIPEAPYWHAAELSGEAGRVPAHIVESWTSDRVDLLDQYLPHLIDFAKGQDFRFVNALKESQRMGERESGFLMTSVHAESGIALDMARTFRLYTLRSTAMLRRLAQSIAERGDADDGCAFKAAAAASSYIDRALADPILRDGIVAFPLQSSVRIQVQAIFHGLEAARIEPGRTRGELTAPGNLHE